MPINEREILSIISELCQERQLMTSVNGSLRGAAITGGSTFLGGLLMGPIGLAFGGVLGGLTAAWDGRNRFRPLYLVITEDLSASQRRNLANRLENAVRDFNITDLAMLLPFLLSNDSASALILRTLGSFIESEMSLKIVERT